MKITNAMVFDANPQTLEELKQKQRVREQHEEDVKHKQKMAKRRKWQKASLSMMMYNQSMRNLNSLRK